MMKKLKFEYENLLTFTLEVNENHPKYEEFLKIQLEYWGIWKSNMEDNLKTYVENLAHQFISHMSNYQGFDAEFVKYKFSKTIEHEAFATLDGEWGVVLIDFDIGWHMDEGTTYTLDIENI